MARESPLDGPSPGPRHPWLTRAIRGGERVLGRRRLAQFARLMTDEVRLDVANDMATNGERIVQEVAARVPGGVVLDVGAHFGEWSESFLSQAGGEFAVHAFEPSSWTADRARKRLAEVVAGERVSVHQQALSDRPGNLSLNVVHDGAGSNSLVPFSESRGVDVEQREPVNVDTVDRFCAAHDIDRVRLLKIDAEGHDLFVMRGASGLLGRTAIDLVQFEYNARWIDARVFLVDAFDLLCGYGYRLGKVTPRGIETYDRWHPELERFVESNFLAYRPDEDIPTISWWGG